MLEDLNASVLLRRSLRQMRPAAKTLWLYLNLAGPVIMSQRELSIQLGFTQAPISQNLNKLSDAKLISYKPAQDRSEKSHIKSLHPFFLQVNSRFLRYSGKQMPVPKYFYFNPCDAVKRIKTTPSESVGKVMDFVEMTRFHELGLALYEAGVARLFPALFTAASLGLRRGEMMALRWQDIDLERDVLSVRQNLTTPGGKPTFGEPKTQHSRRDIPIPLTLKNILLLH